MGTPINITVEKDGLKLFGDRFETLIHQPRLFIISTHTPKMKTTNLDSLSSAASAICPVGGYRVFPNSPSNSITQRKFPNQFSCRTKAEVIQVAKAQIQKENAKIANLYARKKERVKLPNYDDECQKLYPISKFLSQPSGFESILNKKSLEGFQSVESNIYRCILPKIKLLNFEVAPTFDLRVTPTNEDCTVEMLSCKFEGSEAFERQNDRFSAFMRNHITWNTDGEQFLDVDMKLDISLEVYTPPFTLLPVSAIETPGNLVMQSLVDRLVPLLLQQLLQDYDNWIQEQRGASA